MDDYDQIATSCVASSNGMFFDLLILRVSEMLSSHHASLLMDGSEDFRTCLVDLPPNPMTISPACFRSDGSDLFSSCAHFSLSGRGFSMVQISPLHG
jgi:hypothetical protein